MVPIRSDLVIVRTVRITLSNEGDEVVIDR